MPSMSELRAGDPAGLGGYEIRGRLGEGGQGVVYLGVDEQGDQAAIKWLRPNLAGDVVAAERFAREAAVAQRVAPFCTAKVLATGVHEERPFIVSEYVEGPPLRQVVTEEGPRADAALYRLAIGSVTALAAIHQAGIVHRDFSPNNVLLAGEGPRVIDFGIAKALDATSTITSTPVGTPAFMAPEQVLGQPVGPAADMFAWGSTIVFAATGTGPFEAESVPEIVDQVLYNEPDLSSLTGPLRELVAACLSKDPARRPTAEQVIMRLLEHPTSNPAELEQAAAVVSGSPSRPSLPPQPSSNPSAPPQLPLQSQPPSQPGPGFPMQPPSHPSAPPQPPFQPQPPSQPGSGSPMQPPYGQPPYGQPPYAQSGPYPQGPYPQAPYGQPGSYPEGPQPQSGPYPQGPQPQAAHPYGPPPQGPIPQGPSLQGPSPQGPPLQGPPPQGPPPQGPSPQGPYAESGPHQQAQWVSPSTQGQSPQYGSGPQGPPPRSGGKKSYVVAAIAAAVAIVATVVVVAVALTNLPGPPTLTSSPSAEGTATSAAPTVVPTANLVTSTLPDTDAVIYENPGDAVRLTTYLVRDAKTQNWIYYARDSLAGPFTKYPDMWESMLSPNGRYLAQRGKKFVDGYDSVKITDKVSGEAFTVKTSRQPLSAYVQGWSRDSGRLLFNVGNPVKGVWQSTGFAIVTVATRQATVASLREGSLHGIRYGFDQADTGVVALSNDAKQQALRFFDANGVRLRRIPNVGSGIAESLFSPSGKQFVTNCPGLGSGNNCVYDAQTGTELKRFESPCTGLATWYDDSHLVCWIRPDASAEKQQIQVVDFTGTALRLLAEIPTNSSNMDVIYTFPRRN
ncbi:serine/threonine protein kinase [Nonomuraea sp. NPDC049028]|uniref:serine/threonine protein kinase n=1 Tax=Nonomuraea sp. NPDC049028 TaxID=3364348 RepID=UPI00371BD149